MVEANPLYVIVGLLLLIVVTYFYAGNEGRKAGKVKDEEPVKTEKKSAPAPVASSPAAPVEVPASSKPKKKRSNKKKAKKSASPVADSSKPVEITPEPEVEDSESESDDELLIPKVPKKKNAPVVVEKKKVEKKETKPVEVVKPAPKPVPVVETKKPETVFVPIAELKPTSTETLHFDGWAVVEDKRKSKQVKKDSPNEDASTPVQESVTPTPAVVEEVPLPVEEEIPSRSSTPAAPVIETVTDEVLIDSKKIGLLIGTKGVNKIGIQNATGTNIQMPKPDKEATGPVAITVSGTELGVKKAIQALTELAAKGYCSLLVADDFQEGYVAVHPKFLPHIIGKNGSVVKALGAHTGVKITIPDAPKAYTPEGKLVKVKVQLAGPKEKVSLTRSLIKDITKYYHTPITHPDIAHIEMDIPQNYWSFIIGQKGSEIKHIQNNYKVNVYIPDSDSVNPNVLIVGEEAAIALAKKHIDKIIERVDNMGKEPTPLSDLPVSEVPVAPGLAQVQKAPGAAWQAKSSLPLAKEDEPEEPWVNDFAPPASMPLDISAMISNNAAAPAWNALNF